MLDTLTEKTSITLAERSTLYGDEQMVETGTKVYVLVLDDVDGTAFVRVLDGFLSGMDTWIDQSVLRASL